MRFLAYGVLTGSYTLALAVSRFGRMWPRRSWKPGRRLAITGTFHNPGWFFAHILPLARAGFDEVILVTDSPQDTPDGVRIICPPRWMVRLLGRAVSKFLVLLVTTVRRRSDLCMGYHLFPGAITALLVGRIVGRPVCYQMTGGPIEVIGGGVHNENIVMSRLRNPSPFLERLALAVVKEFDLVVVRGTKARRFLADRGLNGTVEVITGGVNSRRPRSTSERGIDLVFVGRLAPIKQPDQFIEIVAGVQSALPHVRAAVLGDGPLLESLRNRATEVCVAGSVSFHGKTDDVPTILAESKIFVLTSRSEGMSIAMIEAMIAGAVPVVADVGELGDLVDDAQNGCVVEPNRIESYVDCVLSLLHDRELWTRYSRAAREAAHQRSSFDVIAARWGRCLQQVIGRAANRAA